MRHDGNHGKMHVGISGNFAMRTRLALGVTVALIAIAASVGPAGTAPAPAPAAPLAQASARIVDANGASIGVVLFEQTARGLRIDISLSRLPPGPHAVHVHSVGKCEGANGFKSAGPHFDVGAHKHGRMAPGGPHTGDMENQLVGKWGFVRGTINTTAFTLTPGPTSLMDADGSSFVVHAAADDYTTQPDGKGGERIGCGVIKLR